MARSDLLISLVRAGMAGDRSLLRSTVEALAAEERAKRHNGLADRLASALQNNGHSTIAPSPTTIGQPSGRDFLLESTPRQNMQGLVLPTDTRAIVNALVEEQHRADLLRSHGLQPRHRILLSGPPGNGKTSLAEAIADALIIPFFTVRYDMLIGSYLGETTQRLRRLFEYVRTVPSVLFFDEFDVVGKERGDPHETGEIKRVVSTLLLQIDALPSYVVVIAATNHSELLDRAVWRRFEIRLDLPRPNVSELAAFFERAFKSWTVPEQAEAISALNIAKQLDPISYAEARDFCLDILRKKVLSLGERELNDIIKEQIRFWKERIGAPDHAERSD